MFSGSLCRQGHSAIVPGRSPSNATGLSKEFHLINACEAKRLALQKTCTTYALTIYKHWIVPRATRLAAHTATQNHRQDGTNVTLVIMTSVSNSITFSKMLLGTTLAPQKLENKITFLSINIKTNAKILLDS